LETDLHKVSRS